MKEKKPVLKITIEFGNNKTVHQFWKGTDEQVKDLVNIIDDFIIKTYG